ncbi:MAG: RNA polymerase sigma factor [Rhodobacteraceae bacterium]|nr:RNA polymerase sigma factor [Paracoccaceae bacterium]
MQATEASERPETDQIDALKAGVPSAWQDLLACHGPALLNYARRMLGDRASAEEIVQDSLVKVYRSIDRFEGRCSLKSWLYRAVHNSAIDEIRRRKKYVDVGDEGEEKFFDAAGRWREDCQGWDGLAAKHLDEKRLLKVVQGQIDQLPHAHREVLLMKDVEGLGTPEICAALDISPGNFRLRIHRARAALRVAVVARQEDQPW